MDYATVKMVHMSAVGLSFAGFFARGLGVQLGAAWVRGGLARRLPHLVDTVLLLSALTLAWLLRLNPFEAPWLLAKLIGLLCYVVLGMQALKPGRSRRLQCLAWLAALTCFGYIVSVAVSKSPWGLLQSFV